jgi:oxygen-dependent protoporphyrinogen oxidase
MSDRQGHIGSLLKSEPVNIIGAGVTGLVIGYYLKKKNIPFIIYESAERVGGKIQTIQTKNGIAEYAANAIYADDSVLDLLKEINQKYYKSEKSLHKFIWKDQLPHSPPFKIRDLLTKIKNLSIKINKEQLAHMSVHEFFSPLVGDKVCDQVIAPAFAGIYAWDIKELHFQSIFNIDKETKTYFHFLWQQISKKKKSRPSSISFEGGMQTFINTLSKSLKDNIVLNSKITDLGGTNIILATDANSAAKIVESTYPILANELLNIQYSKLSIATLITKAKIPYLDSSFGMVFSPNEETINTLGILSNSEIFPSRVQNDQDHSYTFIIKGTQDIEGKLKEDLDQLGFGNLLEQKCDLTIKSWERAIPVYNHQRTQAVSNIRKNFKQILPGLIITGNYIDGISLRQIIANAKTLVESIEN